MNHGVRLEQSMGSSLFAALFFTLTIATNILFLIISILLWGLTSKSNYLMAASLGIWTVLLGIIAVECSEAPPDTKRRLFFIEVPALYYPLVLLALFSMFAGVKLAYVLGVVVGYAYGHGKFDRWKVKVETVSTIDRNTSVSSIISKMKSITDNRHYNILGKEVGKSRCGRVLERFCSASWFCDFGNG